MQHEITHAIPLLDQQGNLTEPGYAKTLLPVYDRSAVKASPFRIKEWDYYYVGNSRFGVALTVADNGYMGLDSISFLCFDGTPWQITKSPMRPLPLGRTGLPSSSAEGVTVSAGRRHALCFRHVTHPQFGPARELTFHMDRFRSGDVIDGQIFLFDEPEQSMVICTPFDKPGCFYFNQKINCLRASGTVSLGSECYRFTPQESFGVLDWGRGVWTYRNTWYWGSASGLVDGVPFGFNIGYGFGNTLAATENMLFYNGKAHKLSGVIFHIPRKDGREDYLSPWTFSSDDGRFSMVFQPILDRSARTNAGVIESDQHQVFGRFSGRVRLDDGTALEIRDFMGFAERVENRW